MKPIVSGKTTMVNKVFFLGGRGRKRKKQLTEFNVINPRQNYGYCFMYESTFETSVWIFKLKKYIF